MSLTKRSDQRLRFKLKNIIQKYNADRKMHQSALVKSLSALNTDERTPTEFPLCQREDDHIIKRVPEEDLAWAQLSIFWQYFLTLILLIF